MIYRRRWDTAVARAFTALALVFLGLIIAGQARAEPIWGQRIRVIDGDTIKVDSQEPVRLVGFNAPETRRAQCDAEHEAGGKATRRLRDLVRDNSLDLPPAACACAPGAERTLACNYGRSCGTLTAGGTDVGTILIAEGLAVPFVCLGTRCPKTPRS